MQANIELNKLSGTIRTHNVALSDVSGPGFLSSAFDTQSGGAKVEQTDHNRFNISKIKLERADNILKLRNERVAIKIDVEGFESRVLDGFRNLLISNEIVLQIEIFDEKLSETSKFLEDLHFKLIGKGTFTHQDTVKDYFYINF